MTASAAINPQAQVVLDSRREAGVPPTWEQTPQEARARFARTRAQLGPGPEVARVREARIPAGGGEIPARVYEPVPDSPATIVYYHGGGWVVGSVDDSDAVCRALAVEAGCTLVSVGYRLAPEHQFPAAADDAYDSFEWAASAAGGRPVIVAGDSAGGNLAAVTALRALHAGGPAPAMQVLVYPATDCDLDRKSYHEYDGTEFLVNRGDMVWFWDQYAPEPAVRRNPYASPLRASSLAGLPPAYVITAEHDPLRDEGFAYAERMAASGVAVTHRHYGSQIHGFFRMVNVLDDADRAVADAAAAIRAAIGGGADNASRV